LSQEIRVLRQKLTASEAFEAQTTASRAEADKALLEAADARLKAEETTEQNELASNRLRQLLEQKADWEAKLAALVQGERDPVFRDLAIVCADACKLNHQIDILKRKQHALLEYINQLKAGRGNKTMWPSILLFKIDQEPKTALDVEDYIDDVCSLLVRPGVHAAREKLVAEHKRKVEDGKRAFLACTADVQENQGDVRHVVRGMLGPGTHGDGDSFLEGGKSENPKQSRRSQPY